MGKCRVGWGGLLGGSVGEGLGYPEHLGFQFN